MKAKTTKSKAPAKAAKPVVKKKVPVTKPAKAPNVAVKKAASAPAKPIKSPPAKTAAEAKNPDAASKGAAARGAKTPAVAKTGTAEAAKTAAAKASSKPAIPRPQLIAQRRKTFVHFRDLLLAKQREQTQAYASSKEDSESNLDNGTEDYIDYAVNSYAREFLLSLTEMDRKQLLQIEEALRRIDRGEFGRCQQCGQEIPRKRLEIQPWARHCVSCQELEEKGLLPQGTYNPGEEDYDSEDEVATAADDDPEVEAEVEEPDEEEPVIDDEPLVVDSEDAEE